MSKATRGETTSPEKPTALPHRPTQRETADQNRATYDNAASLVWQLTVYDPLHDGWRFTNVGGHTVLDFIGSFAGLGPDGHVLELCSGLGDACLYLAGRFGCQVTGVEVNRRQIRLARENVRKSPSALAGRVQFVHQDILTWRTRARFDAVYVLESLMLIADRDRALRTARRVLKGGGALVLADLFAGPRINRTVREFIWREDGMIALPSARQQQKSLTNLGFEVEAYDDLTTLAERRFRTICRKSREHRKRLIRTVGEAKYDLWLRSAETYAAYFHDRRLEYVRLAAYR